MAVFRLAESFGKLLGVTVDLKVAFLLGNRQGLPANF
jgi:hypothetical protein